jgi:hypothetical protein
MANIGDLPALLDSIGARTGRVAQGLGVVSSEFGYETNPPDPFSGIAPVKQAEYINDGDFIAYINPRVFGQTQFLLRDVQPLTRHKPNTKRYWFTYQSGIYDTNDHPKPGAVAYALPFVAFPSGSTPETGVTTISLWGQLRFRPNTDTDHVQIEFVAVGGSEWQPLGEPVEVPPGRGFFLATRDSPGPGYWRAHWIGPEGSPGAVSRAVPLG